MKTLKSVGECCLVFLAIIGILFCSLYVYYHFFVKDITIGVNIISDQLGIDVKKEEDLTEEEKENFKDRVFLEANYYSNSRKNGIELQELMFNYFMNYHLTTNDYRSTGMQYVGNHVHSAPHLKNENEANNYVFPEFNYYDKDCMEMIYSGGNSANSSTSTLLKRTTSFTIKIDNRAFEIKLDKTKLISSGFLGLSKTYYSMTWSELFDSVMASIRSNNKGFGDYYMVLNVSDYFTIYEYDMQSGKYKPDDVSDIIKNYSVLKFHYDENGAISSENSMFKKINYSSKYNANYGENDIEYSQEKMVYNLNEQNLEYRYSDIYNGYFASLSMEMKNNFSNMQRTRVNINLNLNSQYLEDNKINIVGFDYNAFENFKIDTLTITGNVQTFYMLDKALYNTRLQTLKYSNGITFDFAENVINSEYVGVVL